MKKKNFFLKRTAGILVAGVLILALIFSVLNYDVLKRVVITGQAYDYQITKSCSTSVFYENPNFSTEIAKAKDSVLVLKKKFKIPGLSICVAKNGKIIWYEGFGCEDVSSKSSIDSTTLFRVGSISKSMTAIALMKLIHEGNLRLDTKLHQVLDAYPKKKYNLTINQLANHQSGIRHYKGFEMLSNKKYNSVQESLSIFENDDLLFEPGTQFKYSTYNYTILSRIIEKTSGQEYLDYMQNQIFDPLNMGFTFPDLKSNSKGYSTDKDKGTIKNAIEVDVSNKWAGGGFLSTPKDLVNMMINLDSLLPKNKQAKLFELSKLKNGETVEYGIGFRNTYLKKSKKTMLHHGGLASGGRAFLLKIVEDDVVMSICANNDNGLVFPDHFEAGDIYAIAKIFLTKKQ